MININYLIGKELSTIRKEKGFSIDYIAKLCNISTTHLRNIENGNRGLTINSLELHLKALDINETEFFSKINK